MPDNGASHARLGRPPISSRLVSRPCEAHGRNASDESLDHEQYVQDDLIKLMFPRTQFKRAPTPRPREALLEPLLALSFLLDRTPRLSRKTSVALCRVMAVVPYSRPIIAMASPWGCVRPCLASRGDGWRDGCHGAEAVECMSSNREGHVAELVRGHRADSARAAGMGGFNQFVAHDMQRKRMPPAAERAPATPWRHVERHRSDAGETEAYDACESPR